MRRSFEYPQHMLKLMGVNYLQFYGQKFCFSKPVYWYHEINEPVPSKRYMLACGPIKDSDQPAYLRSLIRVFNGGSVGSHEFNASSCGKLRLWSECMDVHWFESSLYVHARIQKIPSGGSWQSFCFNHVINLFYRGLYGPPSRSNWTQWAQLLLEGDPFIIYKETYFRLLFSRRGANPLFHSDLYMMYMSTCTLQWIAVQMILYLLLLHWHKGIESNVSRCHLKTLGN